MNLSPTYAKQEIDVINWIIEKSESSENEEKIELPLKRFRGKHFNIKDYTTEDLLQRIKEILIKFKKKQLINNFFIEDQKITPDLKINFNINNKIIQLINYRDCLVTYKSNVELQNKLKKVNYFWISGNSVFFVLPNGTTQPMTFYSERGSDRMFMIMEILYKQWLDFHNLFISKTELISKLNKLGWENITHKILSNYIGNI